MLVMPNQLTAFELAVFVCVSACYVPKGTPPALQFCISFLSTKRSLQEVGLFRVSGGKSQIHEICNRTQRAENTGV